MDIIIYSGGEIGLDPDMIRLAEEDIEVEYAKGTSDQKTKIHATAKELYLAPCFILGGGHALIWQNQRKQLHTKHEPVSKNN